MKKILTLLLVVNSLIFYGQISSLETSNKILIAPELSKEISTAIINFYINEYQDIKIRIEEEVNLTKSKERKLKLEKDLEILESYLFLWMQEKSKDRTSEFLNLRNLSKCYEIKSNQGTLSQGNYKILQQGQAIYNFFEEIEVDSIPAKFYWVEKAPHENVYKKKGPMFEFRETVTTVPCIQVRGTYQYDQVNSVLFRKIELMEEETIIVDKIFDVVIYVEDWLEKECK